VASAIALPSDFNVSSKLYWPSIIRKIQKIARHTKTASATVTVTEPDVPGVSIDKVADTSEAEPGDTVNYTVTVTNTGDGDLTSFTVTDSLVSLGTDGDIGTLVEDASEDIEYSYDILGDFEGDLENTASVSTDQEVEDSDSATVVPDLTA